ncbi:MAG: 3-hydroxybutyryl-CoA dehydrogenase [Ignavibacteria bacterium]|nr:MAG: 3-hydroxybutyryl-CoA dehydrogenase [Ignavibacteria bacterium]
MIFFAGEPVLVGEFVQLCAAVEYRVASRLNPGEPIPAPARALNVTARIPPGVFLALELTNTDFGLKRKNIEALDSALPQSVPILTSSLTVSATEQASWVRNPRRLTGIGAYPSVLANDLIELAPTVRTDKEVVGQARDFFFTLGKEIAVVQDRVGMVIPRILCMLINEASFALMEEVASPADIDTAMRLGTHYPYGPIEWADRIGIRQVVSVLRALHADLGEERYRISPLLQLMARGEPWWRT